MTNKDVALFWSLGQSAEAGNYKTDGIDLWSYGVKIGRTTDDCEKVLIDPGSKSKTTARHFNLAKKYADRIE